MKALIIVDVQRDFLMGGSLAVPEGNKVVPEILRFREANPDMLVCATMDYHPDDTVHFHGNGGTWPKHCVQGTQGAELSTFIENIVNEETTFKKGQDPTDDAGYSGFEGHNDYGLSLQKYLLSKEVDEVNVCGLATDYCVKATALDAVKLGFKVSLLMPAVRAVNLKPLDGARALIEMEDAGVNMVSEV